MPLFEFVCVRCGTMFEHLVRSGGAQEVTCPKCKGTKVQKQFSSFAVKGSSSNGNALTNAAACAPGGG
jgi:putative FmdB family regulatory protein